MNWADLAAVVGKTAPLLGTLLTGPAGVAISAAGMIASAFGSDSTPDAIAAAVQANPEALSKLREIEAGRQVELQRLVFASEQARLAAETAAAQAVNATMQAESASQHWPSYSWRPFIGFSFGLYINSLWMLPLFGRAPVTLGAEITLAVGGILGVASWFRGKAQADPAVACDPKG